MNSSIPHTNDFEPFWMPYTANRQFKANPRLLVSARDMHYVAADGRRILDATAGLWCCNAGHARPRIVEAVQKQVVELDYAPAFQMGHPKAFELSSRLVQLAPRGLDHVFFTNSGSEAVDTAMPMTGNENRCPAVSPCCCAPTMRPLTPASNPTNTPTNAQLARTASNGIRADA